MLFLSSLMRLQSSSVCIWTTGFRDPRSALDSEGKSKPVQANLAPFEVRMNDFPELAGVSLGKAGPPLLQSACWGLTPQSTNPPTQTPAFSKKVSDLKTPDVILHGMWSIPLISLCLIV